VKKILLLLPIFLLACNPPSKVKLPDFKIEIPTPNTDDLIDRVFKNSKCTDKSLEPVTFPDGINLLRIEQTIDKQETEYVTCTGKKEAWGKRPLATFGTTLYLKAPVGAEQITKVKITNSKSCYKSEIAAEEKSDIEEKMFWTRAYKNGEIKLNLEKMSLIMPTDLSVPIVDGDNILEIHYFNGDSEVASEKIGITLLLKENLLPGIRTQHEECKAK
jgi:hypothetical protein